MHVCFGSCMRHACLLHSSRKHHSLTGQGEKVHVSGFISYPDGRWVDIETIEPSKDGNWTLPKLERQVQRVLKKLENVYPADKYEIVFTFDHSTIHTKLPEDALRVTLMGLNPGGKKGDKMRSTTWVSKACLHPHSCAHV